MKILIDADGCPVVSQTVSIAGENNIEVLIFCDTSHIFNIDGAETVTVSKGADSVDFALVNRAQRGDIVVTQDYGLSAMALSKGAVPITQNGLVIDDNNITMLLTSRYESKKARQAGHRLKGPKKRSSENDKAFCESLERVINTKRKHL